MKCYYEILEISREADDSEIKTSYRKLALKWHPDKNIENTEIAKEQFQLVQQAYEVLSDRQERTWYDNHREQILRGSNSNYEDDSLNIFPYFTTSCFRGYGDDAQGFYTVYRNVFEQIAKEDIQHMDSKSDFDEIPNFGNSVSDYEEIVGPFYAYWMSYTTRKSYVWLDPYNINETRERRVLKLIEKENKKVRQKAKKERNEEIRNLVAFVRKRDKRVQTYVKLLEAKNIENRQKQEELRKQKLMERRKEMDNTTAQADWSKFDNVQIQLKEIEKNLAAQFGEILTDSESESTEECDDLYCVACNKVFKNPKAFANHESSKKHKENVEQLQILMREEDEQLESYIENEEILTDDENISKESTNSLKKKNKKINKTQDYTNGENNELLDIENEEIISDIEKEDENLVLETMNSSKKKNKKSKKVIKIQDYTSEENNELSDIETKQNLNKTEKMSDDEFFNKNSNKQKKKLSRNKTTQEKLPKTIDTDIPKQTNDTPPLNKNLNNKLKNKTIDIDTIDVTHCCVTCKSNFNSKNKLFEHLKKTGHSVLIPQAQQKTKSKKKIKN